MDVNSVVDSSALVAQGGDILPFISSYPRPPGGVKIERKTNRGRPCRLLLLPLLCVRHSSHRGLVFSKHADQEVECRNRDK